MDSITYKCPNCDGGLVFDPESQKFKCEYCLSNFSEDELKALSKEPESAGSAEAEAAEKKMASEMVLYTCQSCGAQIMTDDTTAAAFCYYCHNPVVLSGKLEGRYQPDFVVPFEQDRRKAEELFKTWISRKKYVPRDFYSTRQIEKMEGIYYPYWLYSCTVEGQIEARASRNRVTRNGLEELTEHNHYKIKRRGSQEVKNLSRNALKKADRRLAEAVMPFDMEKSKPFAAGYLSGFLAERRDMENTDFEKEVEAEVREFALTELKGSVSGYDSVTVESHDEKLSSPTWRYALLPVWVLTYQDARKKTYYFAMNGQSGKICGVLPVDYKRLAGLFAMVFFPVFALLLLGGYLI